MSRRDGLAGAARPRAARRRRLSRVPRAAFPTLNGLQGVPWGVNLVWSSWPHDDGGGAMKIRILLVALVLATAAPLAFATDVTQTVLLVAKRNLRDRLYGSTILVARPIGDERHVGFIVNRPTNLTLGKLFPKHTPSQKVIDPVYLGGPTGPEVIFAMVKGRDSPGGRPPPVAPGPLLALSLGLRVPPPPAPPPPG